MWRISLLENTVEVNDDIAAKIFEASKENGDAMWYEVDDVAWEGRLEFNPDDYEHMDYVWREHILEVLKKNKVKGTIKFGCLDGDWFGEFWGYDFDGEGNMTKLKGTISWGKE